MSITAPGHQHPLLAAAEVVAEALDDVAGVDPLHLSVAEKSALLVELTRLAARVTSLRAQVLAVADDLATETGTRIGRDLVGGRDPDLAAGGRPRRAPRRRSAGALEPGR